MKNAYRIIAVLLCASGIAACSKNEGTPIPRSAEGDKGRYYLVEKQREGDYVIVVHKRVGVKETSYTKTEVNCKSMRARELGYSEDSPAAIPEKPTAWFDLVEGSSKSDVAVFACKEP